jgi:mannosyltransferase
MMGSKRRTQARGKPAPADSRRSPAASLFLALGIILVLATILRATGLGRQSLWYDEGVSAYLATLPLAELTAWTAGDIQPPLYYYLLWGWVRLFGYSEIALRALSLLFSLLTVPLAWYAGRRLFSDRAGMLAGLIVATSPLYIWYAQEARNYALLTFLGLLSSLLLFHIVENLVDARTISAEGKRAGVRWPIWAAYILASIAALYTHYFAAFLLAFHTLYGLVTWRRSRGAMRSPWKLIIAWSIIALSYAPWIPHVVGRYGQDDSYWQGALKMGEALRKLLISFSLGESVLEPIGYPLAIGFLALLGLSLFTLWSPADRQRPAATRQAHTRSMRFLALYLLIPIAGVLMLTIWTPKFNPRYLMLASPAFLLFFAGGIDALILAALHARSAPRRMVQLALAGVTMGFLFGSFFYADRNIYADPAFSKADFRGVADYLRAHRTSDEAIILVSGHMFPVFEYYMPDTETLRLPPDRTLSTSHVLGYEIADVLNEGLAGKAGVWVVRWQDDVVDPGGILSLLLEAAGERLPVDASFWHVGLEHYRLPQDIRFPDSPEIAHQTEANFGGAIRLLGWSQPAPDQYVLHWQAIQSMTDDLAVSLRLVDEQGILWGQEDRRPAAYLYPTTRWKPGEILFGRGSLPAQAGAPPGAYWLEVRVYISDQPGGLDILDQAGAPQGRVIRLGPFQLKQAGRTLEANAIALSQVVDHTWKDCIALRGVSAAPDTLSAGSSFVMELAWNALSSSCPALTGELRVHSLAKPDISIRHSLSLFHTYPPTHWQAGEWWRGKDVLRLPADWPAGPASLQLVIADASGPLEPVVKLGAFTAAAPERRFDLPADIVEPLGATAGDLVRLLGLAFEPARPAVGEPFSVTLYWQPLRETGRSYSVFIHLLDTGQQIAAQYDRLPADGTRPSTSWVPGEIIADRYTFERLPTGGAGLALGLYDAGADGMPRLEWRDQADEPLGNMLRVDIPAAP